VAINRYQLKLYAFLRSAEQASIQELTEDIQSILQHLTCLQDDLQDLEQWWAPTDQQSQGPYGQELMAIAASSDRANLDFVRLKELTNTDQPDALHLERVHPISGQRCDIQAFNHLTPDQFPGYQDICQCPQEESEKVFWWFWRFYPEMLYQAFPEEGLPGEGLLFPSHGILPDCPLHSYQATVSALAGARFPDPENNPDEPSHPYLLVFSFSPIQEFIKASRKFADFWAGSYLLHYLSVRLCWVVAEQYGPDAVIVPSLWGQEIVDALLLKDKFPDFSGSMEALSIDQSNPFTRFEQDQSTSLSTAGFPNVITALVPGEAAAQALGDRLSNQLTQIWMDLGMKVMKDIRANVADYIKESFEELEQKKNEPNITIAKLQATQLGRILQELGVDSPDSSQAAPYLDDLQRWLPKVPAPDTNQANPKTPGIIYPGWSWKALWENQLENSWEPYWTAIPLGVPDHALSTHQNAQSYDQWKQLQTNLAQALETIPSPAEETVYSQTFNVGTWWGSLQQRLRVGLQTVKNTRVWAIPSAPGVRSTVSGKFSALHPSFKYKVLTSRGEARDLREGAGLPMGSMRLFWLLMGKVYPGLFNGSEMLNALEITKRMAWVYGEVANDIGIRTTEIKRVLERQESSDTDEEQDSKYTIREQAQLFYDNIVKFPNLSSIAAGRFMLEHHGLVQEY